MHTFGIILGVIVSILLAIGAVSAIIEAIAVLRNDDENQELSRNQRIWVAVNDLIWTAIFVAVIVSIFSSSQIFQEWLNLALGVGLLLDFSLPKSQQPSFFQKYPVVKVVIFALGAWLIVTSIAFLITT